MQESLPGQESLPVQESLPPESPAPIRLTEDEQRLVDDNIALVHYVAGRYRNRGIPVTTYEDLIGRLHYRLCVCAHRFDAKRGLKLSPYVVRSLEGEAKNYFRDSIWMVRPPRSLREVPFSEAVDSLGDELSEAQLQGEDPARIRSCASPVPLDLVVDRGSEDEDGAGLVAPEVDVETEVVNRIGGQQLLKTLYQYLRPEERYILAILTKQRPQSEIQERFELSKPVTAQVVGELQAKVARAYLMLLEGEDPGISLGNEVLNRILRARFVPPDRDFLQLRRELLGAF